VTRPGDPISALSAVNSNNTRSTAIPGAVTAGHSGANNRINNTLAMPDVAPDFVSYQVFISLFQIKKLLNFNERC
jgi:hypothetical protein